MSKLVEEYLALEASRAKCTSEAEEDLILEKMDALWYRMLPPDHDKLNALWAKQEGQ